MKIRIFLSILSLIILHISSVAEVFADVPRRIVSLAPNITEILFALGINDNLIGVTSFCDYPEEARKKIKVGGMSNPSIERIVSLTPDIVVMTTDGNLKEYQERISSLNIRTYVFRARRLSELPQGIRDLGAALDVLDKANLLAQEIENSLNNSALSSQPLAVKKKVLFVVWPEPLIVAGPHTIIDDVITLLGNTNIAAHARISYPKYSVEEIIRQEPEIIIIGGGHVNTHSISESLLKKISKVPAVMNGKICYVSDMLYRLGPRILQGIEEMAECLK